MRIPVVVVGPRGKKLGLPVCEALEMSTDFELVGIIGRPDTPMIPFSLPRDVGVRPMDIAVSFFALVQGLNLSEQKLEEVVVFYAVKADALLARLKEAVWEGFRIHVIGTTGLSPDAVSKLYQMAGGRGCESCAVVQAPNFSLGANIGAEQCANLARQFPDADVEIVEAHHNQKEDAPSGTALYWAHAIAAARRQKLEGVVRYGRHGKSKRAAGEICIHAMRGGSVTGFHRATFFCPNEEVAVEHNARSSALFGQGALRAIAWAGAHWTRFRRLYQLERGLTETETAELQRIRGPHHMADVLNLELLKELGVY